MANKNEKQLWEEVGINIRLKNRALTINCDWVHALLLIAQDKAVPIVPLSDENKIKVAKLRAIMLK